MLKLAIALFASLFLSWALVHNVPSMGHHAFNLLGVSVSWIFLFFAVMLVVCTRITHGK
jgi:hypothetical protein